MAKIMILEDDQLLRRRYAEAFAQEGHQVILVSQVDEALLRHEKGGFGTCCQCGKEIPKERLEAVPHTRYCVTCKRKWEHEI